MIILVSITIIGLIISGYLFCTYIIFHFMPHLTDKIGATVVYKKHKKDVVIRSRRRKTVVDHVTKGIYEYKVGEKYYYKRYTHYFTTYNQTPYMVPIVYLKKFPKISYVNSDTSLGDLYFMIWGMVAFCTMVIMPTYLIWVIFF